MFSQKQKILFAFFAINFTAAYALPGPAFYATTIAVTNSSNASLMIKNSNNTDLHSWIFLPYLGKQQASLDSFSYNSHCAYRGKCFVDQGQGSETYSVNCPAGGHEKLYFYTTDEEFTPELTVRHFGSNACVKIFFGGKEVLLNTPGVTAPLTDTHNFFPLIIMDN